MRHRIKCMDETERAVQNLEISEHIQENRKYSLEFWGLFQLFH